MLWVSNPGPPAAGIQARDIDLAHNLIYIRFAKGGKPAELPIVFEDVRQV